MSWGLLPLGCRLAIVEESDRRILEIGGVKLFKSAHQAFVPIHQLLYRLLKVAQTLSSLNIRLTGRYVS